MGAIKNAVVTMEFQIVLLVLVVVPTISFVAEETVLKAVYMCYVHLGSRQEAVELVARIWGRAKQALKEGRLFVFRRRKETVPVSVFLLRCQYGGKWGMSLRLLL